MESYRIAQDAGSLGDADDCWSIYKRHLDDAEDFIYEEVIAIVQTETLANKLVKAISGNQPKQFIRFLYGKSIANCRWEFIARGSQEGLEQVIRGTEGEYVSYHITDLEIDI